MKELWYFSAPWCGPCKSFGPVMEQLSAEGSIKLRKVNIDYEADVITKFGVRSVPTVILVENGEEVNRFVGARDANFVKQFYNG